jgi:hypothetical protein
MQKMPDMIAKYKARVSVRACSSTTVCSWSMLSRASRAGAPWKHCHWHPGRAASYPPALFYSPGPGYAAPADTPPVAIIVGPHKPV